MKNSSVLLVEDDPASAQYMAAALSGVFEAIQTVSTGTAALLAVESRVPDLAFLDLRLPDIGGLELLALLKQRWPQVPVLFVTAEDSVETVVEAVRRGANNYLVKPVSPSGLVEAARKALTTSQDVRLENGTGLQEVIGVSRSMIGVRHLATLAARSDVNVLITGETGTGKELIARAIHRLSSLRDGPFIAYNCATTPPDLFDSEFFGHRHGAFTGADRDHVGILVQASGGMLLLDELETLGLSQQARLLRVLDDGLVRPLGSSQSRTVSIRFLSATNRDPQPMIREGALREDLYYRLRGFEIALPPLRERSEDIPFLASHFLGDAAPRLASTALAALQQFPWPGNVRQLRNELQRARTLAGDGPIELRHLSQMAAPGSAPGGGERPSPAVGGECRTMRECERQAIVQALSECQGNRSRAARALRIDRSTLRRKMRELGIDS